MLVIETERLVLRELTEADFEAARENLGRRAGDVRLGARLF